MTQVQQKRWARGSVAVLVASLALNGFLLVLTGSRSPGEPIADPGRDAEGVITVPEPIVVELPAPEENTEPTQFHWSEFAVEDLHKYAAKLRESGCPEHVVLGVLADEIRNRYLPLIRPLRRVNSEEHWDRLAQVKSRTREERTPEEKAKKAHLDNLHREYLRLQRELGIRDGRDSGDRFPEVDRDDLLLNFLSQEKQARLRAEDQAVNALRRKLRAESVPEEEVRQRVADLENAQDLNRRTYLEPAEYQEYSLRTSRHSGFIQSLAGFEPTAEEREAILRWSGSAGDEISGDDWENGLRPLLGDARFTEFQRSRDDDYRGVLEMTEHFGLDRAVADEVYAAQQAAEAAAATLRALENVEPEARLGVLAEIRAEAERDVRAQLGEDAFRVYQRRAVWLRELDAAGVGP